MEKNISILGSTGSIGTQALDVVRDLKTIKVLGLSGNQNIRLLEKQALEFQPKVISVMHEKNALELKKRLKNTNIKVVYGLEGLIEVATLPAVDTVLTSVVGIIGLVPTLEAIQSGKNIALANKETLVSAGELVMKKAEEKNVNILPVDSEHSAIFQSLQGNYHNKINRILLTASGGPFLGKTKEQLKNITVEDALHHPNWVMGKKITIDSATLMNKGLEVIEAKWLFHIPIEKIEVLIHPQSIVHSAVEYEDGAVIAQLGETDMKIPIQYALTYPKRIKNNYPKLDFSARNKLTFEKPDTMVFSCLKLAYEAIKIGGTMPAVLNAANEIAVEKFILKKISFLDIPSLIEKTINAYTVKYNYCLEDILQADKWAREYVLNVI